MNTMKTRLRSVKLAGGLGLLLALGLIAALAVPVLAVPQQPHQFYGTVSIEGALAPEGTIVSAQIDGVEYESGTVDAEGRYGYDSLDLFKVPADDPDTPEKEGGEPGETVEFYITNDTLGLYDAKATEEADFEIWGSTNLNLTIDTTPPEVISTSPVNGATGVAVGTVVTATFNEPIDEATIVFTLDSASGTVTYADTIATFTPDTDLNGGTVYNASIQASDLAGNPMTAPYTWSFTTQGPPGTLDLIQGVNIIAYTGVTTDLPEALTNIGPDVLDVVAIIWARGAWTGGDWLYYNATILFGTLNQLEAGKAYIIVVTEDCIWELPQ